MKNIKIALKNESGQGMTEYIIIVALIAIAAIGVITFFGSNIRDLFGSSASALSGNTNQSRSIPLTGNRVKDKGLDNATDNADESAGHF